MDFFYEDVELITEDQLLGLVGVQETIIGKDLEPIIPLGSQQIFDLRNHWILKSKSSQILDQNLQVLISEVNRTVNNDQWLGLKRNDKWAIQHQDSVFNPQFILDSLKLLSDDIVLAFTKDSSYALFSNYRTLRLDKAKEVKLVKATLKTTSGHDSIPDFLLIINEKGVKRLYNARGRKILAGKFDQVTPINEQLFIIEEKNKKGLSNQSGRNVLPIKNDAIGDFFDGNISLLNGGKFGLYNYYKKKTI